MSGTLMSLAQMPVQRRDFPVAPEPAIPPGAVVVQNQGAGFEELDTVHPTALMMLRMGIGQTIPQTSRLVDLAMNAALNFAGTTPMRGVQGVRAYHGSPHDFDRFRMDRIGTGEGAQAYGHGLYFAESEGVARSYRDTLSRPTYAPEYVAANLEYQNVNRAITNLHERMVEESRRLGARAADDGWGDLGGEILPEVLARFKPEADALAARGNAAHQIMLTRGGLIHNPGRMYEVNLNVDPNRLLDWDAPLSQQAQETQRALMNLPGSHRFQPEWTGANLYESAALVPGATSDSAAAAAALREAGVPGIRYLDQGSRAAGDGTRNYVMFDDSLIEIIRKYGLAGLGLGLGANAYGGEPAEQ